MSNLQGARYYSGTRGIPRLSILSRTQLDKLHQATLEVLENTGVQVCHKQARKLLRDAGSRVSGERVKIPRHLVEYAIEKAPSEGVLYSREGIPSLFLGSGQVYFGPGGGGSFILDPFSQKKRKVVREDIEKAALLCDYLPNIDYIMSLGCANDVPSNVHFQCEFEAMVNNTTKSILFQTGSIETLQDIFSMASLIVGGREEFRKKPFILHSGTSTSPLKHAKEGVDKLFFCAENGIPIKYTSGISIGGTGPVTLAGAVVTATADQLAGLVMAQLKKEGSLYLYGGTGGLLDMSSSIFSYGAPESHLFRAVLAQLGAYYGLPVFGTAGITDANDLDQQAGIEWGYGLLWNALMKVDLIHDVGLIEHGSTTSFESLIICNELIDMVKRILRGIVIDKESLAIDVIEKVGPGGHFLLEEHTLENFRKEFWFPKLISRKNYEEWIMKGRKSLRDRASEEVKKILSEYSPKKSISLEVREEMKKIIQSRETSHGKK